jgi:hypothetical protein
MLSDKHSYTSICTEDEDGNVILDFPEELLDAMGWGEGTLLEIDALADRILLREVKKAPESDSNSLVGGECLPEGGDSTVEGV